MLKVLRIRSQDSMTRTASRPTLDAILKTVTPAEMAAYFARRAKINPGMVWDGMLKPMLQALDKKTRDDLMGEITNYGNELATSMSIAETAASGLIFGGQNDEETNPDGSIGEGKPNQTQDNIGCNSKGGKTMRSWRDKNTSAIDAINNANAKFWNKG